MTSQRTDMGTWTAGVPWIVEYACSGAARCYVVLINWDMQLGAPPSLRLRRSWTADKIMRGHGEGSLGISLFMLYPARCMLYALCGRA